MITGRSIDTGARCRRGRGNRPRFPSGVQGAERPAKELTSFKPGCSGRRAAGVPTPAPRSGLPPRTPNLSWLANERFVCHASGMPKRWQHTKEASLCMEVCNLAHSVSSDADAPRNGGMTTSGALDTGARCRRGSGRTGTGSTGRGHGGDAPRYNHIYSSSEFAQAARPLGFPPQHPAAGAVAQTPYFVASLLH